MNRWLIPAIILAVSFLIAVPVHAQGWYLDMGLEFVDLGQDLSNVNMGLGLALNLGLNFNESFALNLGIGSSAHQEDGFGTTYSRFWLGPRVIFDSGGIKPYLEAGIMSHIVTWDFLFYDIDGTGMYVGAGALWPMAPGNSLSAYFKYSTWDGEDSFGTYGDVSTTIVGVSYIFGF